MIINNEKIITFLDFIRHRLEGNVSSKGSADSQGSCE